MQGTDVVTDVLVGSFDVVVCQPSEVLALLETVGDRVDEVDATVDVVVGSDGRWLLTLIDTCGIVSGNKEDSAGGVDEEVSLSVKEPVKMEKKEDSDDVHFWDTVDNEPDGGTAVDGVDGVTVGVRVTVKLEFVVSVISEDEVVNTVVAVDGSWHPKMSNLRPIRSWNSRGLILT